MSNKKNKVIPIQVLIQNFFLERLIQQRGVTSRTIESYRDTFKIYIKYLQETFNISVEDINITDFNQEKVLLFLKYLEEKRNNKPITLNNRLSVIHSFMRYVAEFGCQLCSEIENKFEGDTFSVSVENSKIILELK